MSAYGFCGTRFHKACDEVDVLNCADLADQKWGQAKLLIPLFDRVFIRCEHIDDLIAVDQNKLTLLHLECFEVGFIRRDLFFESHGFLSRHGGESTPVYRRLRR